MDNHRTIQNIRKHIQKVRNSSPELEDREVRIALGKVIFDLKDAQKSNKGILKAIFSL